MNMWPRIINIITGLWIIAAPLILRFDEKIATNHHVAGPLVISIAVISISESVRNFRYVNVIAGLWMLLVPWLLNYDNNTAIINSLFCGIIIICCSLIRGNLSNRFGGGWRSLFRKDPPHMKHRL